MWSRTQTGVRLIPVDRFPTFDRKSEGMKKREKKRKRERESERDNQWDRKGGG